MSKKIVFIACGHGKSIDGSWDPGCAYKGMTEAELMLPITKACVAYLRGSGVIVYTDVPKNDKNMIADVTWANKLGVDRYVSIHCDYKLAKSGTAPLYLSGNGKRLAQHINKRVVPHVHIRTRGLDYRSDLYELNATNMPAVIFETGSISQDNKLFRAHPDRYGKWIAAGICDDLGVKFKGTK